MFCDPYSRVYLKSLCFLKSGLTNLTSVIKVFCVVLFCVILGRSHQYSFRFVFSSSSFDEWLISPGLGSSWFWSLSIASYFYISWSIFSFLLNFLVSSWQSFSCFRVLFVCSSFFIYIFFFRKHAMYLFSSLDFVQRPFRILRFLLKFSSLSELSVSLFVLYACLVLRHPEIDVIGMLLATDDSTSLCPLAFNMLWRLFLPILAFISILRKSLNMKTYLYWCNLHFSRLCGRLISVAF